MATSFTFLMDLVMGVYGVSSTSSLSLILTSLANGVCWTYMVCFYIRTFGPTPHIHYSSILVVYCICLFIHSSTCPLSWLSLQHFAHFIAVIINLSQSQSCIKFVLDLPDWPLTYHQISASNPLGSPVFHSKYLYKHSVLYNLYIITQCWDVKRGNKPHQQTLETLQACISKSLVLLCSSCSELVICWWLPVAM